MSSSSFVKKSLNLNKAIYHDSWKFTAMKALILDSPDMRWFKSVGFQYPALPLIWSLVRSRCAKYQNVCSSSWIITPTLYTSLLEPNINIGTIKGQCNLLGLPIKLTLNISMLSYIITHMFEYLINKPLLAFGGSPVPTSRKVVRSQGGLSGANWQLCNVINCPSSTCTITKRDQP